MHPNGRKYPSKLQISSFLKGGICQINKAIGKILQALICKTHVLQFSHKVGGFYGKNPTLNYNLVYLFL